MFDNFIAEQLNTFNKDGYFEYLSLSEGIKAKVENVVVERLFQLIKARYNELDLTLVHQTGGDITKLYNYKYLESIIEFGKNVLSATDDQKNTTQYKQVTSVLNNYLEVVSKALNNFKLFKAEFIHAYQENNEFVKFIYGSTIIGLLLTTNLLFTFMIDYVKDSSSDSYVLEFKKSFGGDRISLLKTLIGNVNKFNELCENGNMKQLFANKVITNESVITEDFATIFMVFFTVTGAIAAFYSIKGLVWYFYKVRQSVSEYLDILADMVELNKEALRNKPYIGKKPMFGATPKDNKQIMEKQEKWIARLRNWSRKLEVSVDVATNEIKKEEVEENKKLYSSVKPAEIGTKQDEYQQPQQPIINNGSMI